MAIPDKMVCPQLSRTIKQLKGWSETDENLWGMAAGFILLILLTVNLAMSVRIYLNDHNDDNDTFSDIICELCIDPIKKINILREAREAKTGDEH